MPVRDERDGRGEQPDEGKERAPAGGARFSRRHVGVLVAVVALGLVAFAALRGTGDHGTGTAGTEGSEQEGPPTGRSAAEDPATVGGTDVDPSTTLTTLTPPDVAHERPAVDLDVVPATGDPVEVARWWAATYVVYDGAEPPIVLADRLAPLTEPGYLQSLRDRPPAASYDAPLELAGVTGEEVASGAGTKVVRVPVETTVAIVVYDVTLTEASPGSWLVRQASRV